MPGKYIHIKQNKVYTLTVNTAKWMDNYNVDPMIGLVPTLGDMVSTVFAIPVLYLSVFKIRSMALTLAIINNILFDLLIGIVPYMGAIMDFFFRSYNKNLRLLDGFIHEDKQIMNEINKSVFFSLLCISIFLFLIYLIFKFMSLIISSIGSLVEYVF